MGQIEIKTAEQIRWMREAGLIVAKIHQALREAATPGVSLKDLDAVSEKTIRDCQAHSNFLGYYGFPATVCISVNDTVVHGIPDNTVLQAGDLVSFDCGAYVLRGGKQWHGDAAFTMIVGESGSPEAERLNRVTEEAMWAALAALATGKRISAVGETVEEVVAANATAEWEAGIIEEYTGHGIGTEMHQNPYVPNYGRPRRGARLGTGMCLAIEPIFTLGSPGTVELDDEWTVVTEDNSWAAHWENTVAITEGGVWVLTARDGGAEGLAPFGITPSPA